MSAPIELVAGLGNPGRRYERTRHNVGFWLVDRLAARAGAVLRAQAKFFGELCAAELGGRPLRLLKPQTFMNHSGRSVGAVARYFGIEPARVLVIHDEVDLPPGVVRLKVGGGAAGHNGVADIVRALGSPDFVRLRIGVGHPGRSDDVHDHVLHAPSAGEAALIDEAMGRVMEVLDGVLAGEHARVMNVLNQKRRRPDEDDEQTEPAARC